MEKTLTPSNFDIESIIYKVKNVSFVTLEHIIRQWHEKSKIAYNFWNWLKVMALMQMHGENLKRKISFFYLYGPTVTFDNVDFFRWPDVAVKVKSLMWI